MNRSVESPFFKNHHRQQILYGYFPQSSQTVADPVASRKNTGPVSCYARRARRNSGGPFSACHQLFFRSVCLPLGYARALALFGPRSSIDFFFPFSRQPGPSPLCTIVFSRRLFLRLRCFSSPPPFPPVEDFPLVSRCDKKPFLFPLFREASLSFKPLLRYILMFSLNLLRAPPSPLFSDSTDR